MFLNIAIITGFIFFTVYFVYKFVRNDFKGLTIADQEKSQTEMLLSIIEQIMNRLEEKEKNFVKNYGEDFALQYFDLKVKKLEKERKKEKKLKNFYFFSAVKLEGELIFLINYLKKNPEILARMNGIVIPDEYYSIAKQWESECENYFKIQ